MSATHDRAGVSTALSARLGRFSYRTVSRLWDWDDEVFRLLGLRPGSVTPTVAYMLSCDDPALRAQIRGGLLRAETYGEPFHVSYRLRAADGVDRRVLMVGEPASPANARPVGRIDGHYIDLTEDFHLESVEVARQAVIEATQHRATIEQAVGGLMVAYGLDADQAFEMLRWWSQNRNVKVRDLAARLTEAASRGRATRSAVRTTFDALLHDITRHDPPQGSSPAPPS